MDTNAQVICVGNEIMLGHIANTNAQFISNKLAAIGIKTSKHLDIPDNPEVIISSIRKALSESEIVILSGGLGPTVDDLTLECISKALNKKLIFNKKIAERIKAHFKRRNIKMPANNLRQAFIPESAMPILNNIGTAPGLIIPVSETSGNRRAGLPVLRSFSEGGNLPYGMDTYRKNFYGISIIFSYYVSLPGFNGMCFPPREFFQ